VRAVRLDSPAPLLLRPSATPFRYLGTMSTDWAAVYNETYSDLVRFLHRKVWDGDRAQDLAQEVFVKALDADPDNPRAWLFTVANNLARDEARAAVRRRKHLVLIKGEAEARQEAAPIVGDDVEHREQIEAVRKALESLSEKDRTVLLLWDAGFNYDEIAAQANLSKGAVGTTLARARARLVETHGRLEGQDAASR
jgi:RNA polymerase sigma-70 factor (ECF subfamily)